MTDPQNPEASENEPRPWQQQEGETESAYVLFQQFLDLGPDATHKDLAQQNQRSVNAIRLLSSRHNWTDRAAAWRQHLAKIKFQTAENATRERVSLFTARAAISAQLDWENAARASELERHLLDQFLNRSETKCSVFELIHLMRTNSDLRRKSAQLLVEQPEGLPLPSAAVNPQVLRALQAVYANPPQPPDALPPAALSSENPAAAPVPAPAAPGTEP